MADKKTIIAGACAVLTLITVIFTSVLLCTERPVSYAPATFSNSEPSPETAAPRADNTSAANISSDVHKFILREYNGSIGVFEEAEDLPFITLDVPVSALRTADADRLRRGITVFGEMAFARMIEDFDG